MIIELSESDWKYKEVLEDQVNSLEYEIEFVKGDFTCVQKGLAKGHEIEEIQVLSYVQSLIEGLQSL
jgi:hypothetical protein